MAAAITGSSTVRIVTCRAQQEPRLAFDRALGRHRSQTLKLCADPSMSAQSSGTLTAVGQASVPELRCLSNNQAPELDDAR